LSEATTERYNEVAYQRILEEVRAYYGAGTVAHIGSRWR